MHVHLHVYTHAFLISKPVLHVHVDLLDTACARRNYKMSIKVTLTFDCLTPKFSLQHAEALYNKDLTKKKEKDCFNHKYFKFDLYWFCPENYKTCD